MNIKSLHTASLAAATAFGLFIGVARHATADEVVESFQRMLAHEPAQSSTAAAVQSPADPLIEAVVIPLRDGVWRVLPRQADQLADSFDRMLAHTPNPVPPAAPPSVGADPLVAAMVEPLRQWQTGAAATAKYAADGTARKEH